MTNGKHHHSPSMRGWAVARLVLGGVQMAGAFAALALLLGTGVTREALIVVVATTAATSISVMLFGRDRPRGMDP